MKVAKYKIQSSNKGMIMCLKNKEYIYWFLKCPLQIGSLEITLELQIPAILRLWLWPSEPETQEGRSRAKNLNVCAKMWDLLYQTLIVYWK